MWNSTASRSSGTPGNSASRWRRSGELLDLSDSPERSCAQVDAVAQRQLREVEARIARLEALRVELRPDDQRVQRRPGRRLPHPRGAARPRGMPRRSRPARRLMPAALVYPLAALAEIAGCFAIWAWWRGASSLWLLPGTCEPRAVRLAARTGRGRLRRAGLCRLWRRLHRRLAALDVGRRRAAAGSLGSRRRGPVPTGAMVILAAPRPV